MACISASSGDRAMLSAVVKLELLGFPLVPRMIEPTLFLSAPLVTDTQRPCLSCTHTHTQSTASLVDSICRLSGVQPVPPVKLLVSAVRVISRASTSPQHELQQDTANCIRKEVRACSEVNHWYSADSQSSRSRFVTDDGLELDLCCECMCVTVMLVVRSLSICLMQMSPTGLSSGT